MRARPSTQEKESQQSASLKDYGLMPSSQPERGHQRADTLLGGFASGHAFLAVAGVHDPDGRLETALRAGVQGARRASLACTHARPALRLRDCARDREKDRQ